jgi:hypothetical protein
MALYLRKGSKYVEWHIGEPLPFVPNRMTEIMADGDELDLILSAMDPAYGPHGSYPRSSTLPNLLPGMPRSGSSE